MYTSFVESVARTHKLHCSNCQKPIKKGEDVIFELQEYAPRMKEVFCHVCKREVEWKIEEDDFSSEDYE